SRSAARRVSSRHDSSGSPRGRPRERRAARSAARACGSSCGCGGTGIRTGFRSRRSRGHEGSTPSIRTASVAQLEEQRVSTPRAEVRLLSGALSDTVAEQDRRACKARHGGSSPPGVLPKGETEMTTLEIVEQGTILRATVGSTAHGLHHGGQDDRDEMAVFIEPPEYLLGLRLARKQGVRNPYRFEHWVERTQPEGARSGPGDLDLVAYSLRKYVRLALKGHPTVLLLLFVP